MPSMKNNLPDISASKGRNVGEQFAHMHNVRLMWLKVASPELFPGTIKLKKKARSQEIALVQNLQKAPLQFPNFLKPVLQRVKIKGFKPHPSAFFGYLVYMRVITGPGNFITQTIRPCDRSKDTIWNMGMGSR
jgi:hypothetical protein